ncbi:hypothetical protein EYF80_061700 [Liparis tanakae]|uniref:Uncharacterized protein n=1 Tax=Liparis tanakae TaxID=230148 RepID=A0A4Z2EHJ8_9TELE|nr:hypothetical protein EYF80_061700 [Liparis tanakae]
MGVNQSHSSGSFFRKLIPLGVLSVPLPLPRPVALGVPLPVCSSFSVFQRGRLLRASGHEVPPGVRRAAVGLQLVPDVGRGALHVAPSVRPAGPAGQDQRLGAGAQQPVRVAAGGPREDEAPHGDHHAGRQGLRGPAVRDAVQSGSQ